MRISSLSRILYRVRIRIISICSPTHQLPIIIIFTSSPLNLHCTLPGSNNLIVSAPCFVPLMHWHLAPNSRHISGRILAPRTKRPLLRLTTKLDRRRLDRHGGAARRRGGQQSLGQDAYSIANDSPSTIRALSKAGGGGGTGATTANKTTAEHPTGEQPATMSSIGTATTTALTATVGGGNSTSGMISRRSSFAMASGQHLQQLQLQHQQQQPLSLSSSHRNLFVTEHAHVYVVCCVLIVGCAIS